MSGYFDDFTNLYKVNKTLRFELKPIGKTEEIIKEKIKNDEKRAKAYKIVKPLIDEYHIQFIDEVLSGLRKNSELKKYIKIYSEIYSKANSTEKRQELSKISKQIRKMIHNAFGLDKENDKESDNHKKLFGEKLIKEILPNRKGLKKEEDDAIKLFSNFSTYFIDFQANRENIYSEENQNTAIPHRIVDDNLPMFIFNINNFQDIKQILSVDLSELGMQFSDILNGKSLDDVFNIENYTNCLTQTDIERYNAIIGGVVSTNGERRGLNQRINEYNQKNKTKLNKFRQLYKQILSERKPLSWLPEKFENDNDLTNSIKKAYIETKPEIERFINICKSLGTYDINGIYIKNQRLDVLSKDVIGNWQTITKALENRYRVDNPIGRKSQEKYEKEIDNFCEGVFSIGYLNSILSEITDNKIDLTSFFSKIAVSDADKINKAYNDVKSVLESDHSKKLLSESEREVEAIKNFLDSLKDIQRRVDLFATKDFDGQCDEIFITDILEISEKLSVITTLYNKVRNRITERPNNDKKFKLKFDYPTLLAGWDENREEANKCVILRDNGKYYLAIADDVAPLNESVLDKSINCYEKMVYKFTGNLTQQIPRIAFSEDFKKGHENYFISHPELKIPSKGATKALPTKILIPHLIYFVNNYGKWQCYGLKTKKPNQYKSYKDFCDDIKRQNYQISFNRISKKVVEDLNNQGKLCLFQIYNKDFSEMSNGKGKPNLHTMYWHALFDAKNLANVVYKLDGEAKAFFRPRVINDNKITHPKDKPIECKSIENKGKTKTFSYDIIKDKRYRSDKYYIHIPITINDKLGKPSKFNDAVNSYIKKNQPNAIIGIDRGERNLIYISVIDLKGNILEQKSFNTIVNRYNDKEIKVNYHDLLDKKEKERQASRQSWKTIENIKDLKSGYLSAVIHDIANLMIKYNAILVMEDLNFGFKKGRFKIEKQVYQNFEKALINKLNCLIIDKNKDITKPGGLLKPYQLCDKFESLAKMGKQQGFIFYVDASYTSKIDPVTGFVNFFDTSYQSVVKAKEFFSKFSSIRFNRGKNYYEFKVDDYSLFNEKAKKNQSWLICSQGDRIKTEKKNNIFVSSTINLTEEFENLFKDLDKSKEMKDQILARSDAEFYRNALYLLKLTVQLRNSNNKTGEDYIISPVSKKGVFYDSRYYSEKDKLPCDADANGAYNIARKGIIVLESIKKNKKILAISRDVWLNKAQE